MPPRRVGHAGILVSGPVDTSRRIARAGPVSLSTLTCRPGPARTMRAKRPSQEGSAGIANTESAASGAVGCFGHVEVQREELGAVRGLSVYAPVPGAVRKRRQSVEKEGRIQRQRAVGIRATPQQQTSAPPQRSPPSGLRRHSCGATAGRSRSDRDRPTPDGKMASRRSRRSQQAIV